MDSTFYYVNKLVIDASTNILWAGTRKGLFMSSDGGASFAAKVSGGGLGDVHCTDVEVGSTSPSIIYASFGIFGGNAAIWRSTDGGSSFTANLSNATYGRIEMATSPSNPQIAYVSIMDPATNQVGLFGYTTNGGDNWYSATIAGPAFSGPATYTSTQAWYNNIVAVDPTDPAIVYAGGLDFWKSTDGGGTWTQKTNWYPDPSAPPVVHADQHAIAVDPSNSNVLFLGTDGGIFKTTNKGETWINLNNNLFITQFYYGAVDPSANNYYGGAQDNGTLKSTGNTSWFEICGGDGGAVEVDFTTPSTVYMEYVHLTFYKSTDGGASYTKSMNGIPSGTGNFSGATDRSGFIAPFSMDPNNSSSLVAGTYRIFRTTDAAGSWSAISGDLTGDGTGAQGATISTVTIAKGNSNVIYSGCTNGMIQVTTDGGSNWNTRTTGLPDAWCTRIATDPTNPAVAYASFSGFVAGSKIYKTTNYGVSWSNISSNLPNIPVSCILVGAAGGNTMYAGTDLGVFTTIDGGGNWTQDNNGLANVVVMDLDYRASDNKLFAATHGRGMFSAPLAGGSGSTSTLRNFNPAGAQNVWRIDHTLPIDSGFLLGTNHYQDKAKATFFRLPSGQVHGEIKEVKVWFGYKRSGLTTEKYRLQLYNGTATGGPNGVPLLNQEYNLADVLADDNLATAEQPTVHTLSSPVSVDTTFFVAVDFGSYSSGNFGDAGIAAGPLVGSRIPEEWELWNDDSWHNISDAWFNSTSGVNMWIEVTVTTGTTDVGIEPGRIPTSFELQQNYPNPFNPSTVIRYSIPTAGNVTLKIYDLLGRELRSLVSGYQQRGAYEVVFNADGLPSGTYFYEIRSGNFADVKKMILIR